MSDRDSRLNEGSNPLPLGLYRHYKGGMYEVIGLARHSETLEELVVYKCTNEYNDLSKGSLWVRPRTMFLEQVVINGQFMPRFTLIKQLSRIS